VDRAEKGVFAIKSTVTRENYSQIEENVVMIMLNSAVNKIEKLLMRERLNKAYEELQTYQGKLSNEFRLAAIGELTEGILEEISTPLQVIVSLVDLLEMEDTNSVEIAKIKTQVSKIDKVVKRLVRFTNLNHRNIPLMPININDAIRDYYNLVESTLRSAHIECALDLRDNIPSILSHPTYIHQILTNLFGLVRKQRNKTNGIVIQTRSKGDDIILRFVTSVKLTDNLSEKNLNYRIVQNLVKKHEGESSLEDTLDSGSVIVLRFPLIRKIRG
jgi:signal transduction histidine kinase